MSVANIGNVFLEWEGHLTEGTAIHTKTNIVPLTNSTQIREVTRVIAIKYLFLHSNASKSVETNSQKWPK